MHGTKISALKRRKLLVTDFPFTGVYEFHLANILIFRRDQDPLLCSNAMDYTIDLSSQHSRVIVLLDLDFFYGSPLPHIP